VEIIGFGLALLYATSCLIFLQYLDVPEFKLKTVVYVFLFGTLFVGSIAVMTLKEWGRKLLVVLNSIMLMFFVVHYIPKIDLAPLAYVFMNVIVLLYFTQSKVKLQFRSAKHIAWHKSILVVDDDETIIKMVRMVLLSHGYSVLTAGTGEDGLQIARTQKPDLILLDVILPGVKGREVCKQLKEDPALKDIPVVFLTAKDSPEDIQAEKDVGAAAHLTKPVNSKKLMETIQGVLAPRGAKK
jgi:CheY-like chemotaxis protein